MLGARGNDEFKHPEVVAVNKFRAAMSGQKEKVDISDNGQVLVVSRGKKGAVIVNNLHTCHDFPPMLSDTPALPDDDNLSHQDSLQNASQASL